MRIEAEEKYGTVRVRKISKMAKKRELPEEYLNGSNATVFMWNDGNGFSVISRDVDGKVDKLMTYQVGLNKPIKTDVWNQIVWPIIQEAGSNLTKILAENGWKLGKPVAKVYET